MRVHELAKELGVTSKDIIAQIEKAGGTAKNHMAVVEDSMIATLRKSQSGASATATKEKEKKETAAPVAKKAPAKKVEAPAAKAAAPKIEETPKAPAKPAAPAEPVRAK